MLEMHKEIIKEGGFAVSIKPQIQNEEGEWIKNKDYKLKLLGARKRKVVPKSGGKPFELVSYNCEILENGETRKGVYEISMTNRVGELNYQIKRMIELELGAGDIFTLKTDEKGFIDIQIVEKAKGKVEELSTIDLDDDEILDETQIPF